jgi:hypothetical protein
MENSLSPYNLSAFIGHEPMKLDSVASDGGYAAMVTVTSDYPHCIIAYLTINVRSLEHIQARPTSLRSIPSNPGLIPGQTPLPRKLMLNNWLRVSILLRNARSLLVLVRIVYCPALYILQLLYPRPDKLAVLVELLRLKPWVEDAEVGLWVNAGRGREPPAAIIGCEVAVNEVRYEVLLAEAPVEKEVFG